MTEKIKFDCDFNLKEDVSIFNNNFKKVRIRMMHNDSNKNGSFFDLESIIKAKKTLDNIPILGYIEDSDFKGHEIDYEIETNQDDELTLKTIYKETPMGVIPSNNNFELVEEDGLIYVEVDGIIWESYSNSGWDIISKSQNKKVSMEISVQNGFLNDEDGLYHITSFQFEGVTILGDDLETGMYDTYLTKFTKNSSKYNEYIKSFNKAFNKIESEGKENVELENEVKQEEIVEEALEEVEEAPIVEETFEEVVEIKEETTEVEKEFVANEITIDEITYTIEDLKSKFAQLKELQEFKANYEKNVEVAELNSNVEEVISKFEFEEEEISELKEKALNKDIDLQTFELNLKGLAYDKTLANKEVKFNKEDKPTKIEVKAIEKDEVDDSKDKFEEIKAKFLKK